MHLKINQCPPLDVGAWGLHSGKNSTDRAAIHCLFLQEFTGIPLLGQDMHLFRPPFPEAALVPPFNCQWTTQLSVPLISDLVSPFFRRKYERISVLEFSWPAAHFRIPEANFDFAFFPLFFRLISLNDLYSAYSSVFCLFTLRLLVF